MRGGALGLRCDGILDDPLTDPIVAAGFIPTKWCDIADRNHRSYLASATTIRDGIVPSITGKGCRKLRDVLRAAADVLDQPALPAPVATSLPTLVPPASVAPAQVASADDFIRLAQFLEVGITDKQALAEQVFGITLPKAPTWAAGGWSLSFASVAASSASSVRRSKRMSTATCGMRTTSTLTCRMRMA